jgi:dienelactone hydrolase
MESVGRVHKAARTFENEIMRTLIACLFTASSLWAAPLPNLQRPPSPLPADLPKLACLMTNASGQSITKRADWAARREELQRDWTKFLGEFPKSKVALEPEFLAKEELPTITRQKVTYQIEDGVRIDAMLLAPKNATGKLPGIVLFHPTYTNHFARAVGLEGEPERAQAVLLAEHGYVVLAPRSFIYSELPAGYQKKGERIWEACTRWMRQRHPTWRAMTRMTWDGIRALDFMQTLPNVDAERIGIFGHSLGAKEVLYVAAFDPRVKCTVFSEGGIGLHFSNWDAVWYLGSEINQPGFPREQHELLGLVAPRPFLLLAGNSADNDKSWAFIEAALPAYQLLGAPQDLAWFNHGLGHYYGGEPRTVAETFLDRHLKLKQAAAR